MYTRQGNFEIFTSAVKSYLTYPYPTRGIYKNRITTRVVNTLVVYEVTLGVGS